MNPNKQYQTHLHVPAQRRRLYVGEHEVLGGDVGGEGELHAVRLLPGRPNIDAQCHQVRARWDYLDKNYFILFNSACIRDIDSMTHFILAKRVNENNLIPCIGNTMQQQST